MVQAALPICFVASSLVSMYTIFQIFNWIIIIMTGEKHYDTYLLRELIFVLTLFRVC